MKRILVSVLCIGLFVSGSQAVSSGKIKAYINSLEKKIAAAEKKNNGAKADKLYRLLADAENSLDMVSDQDQGMLMAAKPKAAVQSVPVVSAPDELSDYKEEVNAAFAQMKAEIGKVASDNKDAKVSGVIFFRWQKYLANGTASTPNNFDVERAYIDLKKKLSGGASARVVLDVSRLSNDSKKNLFDYLKYAYADIPLGLGAMPVTLTGKIGLQHTVWIDWADKMLGQRWIAKSLVDNESVMSSADFGLGAVGKITTGNFPEVEYHATAMNGTGYGAAETNSSKDAALRLNSTVLESKGIGNLQVGLWGNVRGITSSNLGGDNNLFGGMVGWKAPIYTLYVEYLGGQTSSKNISGFSVGGKCEVYAGVNAFLRVDNYNPDTSGTTKKIDRTFYGVTYDVNKDVKLSADIQTATGGSAASTSKGTTTSIFYLHSMIAY